METIKIAPSLEEVTLEDGILKTHFNSMDIEYRLAAGVAEQYTHESIRKGFCQAIALSGKLWQLPFLLNNNGVHGECYVNGEHINYPKD